MRKVFTALLVSLGALAGAEVAKNYRLPFGPNPFAPGEASTRSGGFLAADRFIPAAYCGRCHQAAYRQWQQSAHRNSFREPFYKKNVELFIEQQGIEITRHCEGCHNPVALVSGALTSGSKLPRPFDDEGVTCTVCHSIDRVTSLEGIASYELAAPALLADAGRSAILDDQQILRNPERHKRAMMKDLYRTPEFCAACHKSAMPRQIEAYKWRRAFSAYDEWQTSSHSNESVLPFYHKPRNTCQSCHMPRVAVDRDLAAVDGKLASHRWAAANTAIPFYYGFREQLEAVRKFLADGRLKIDIFSLEKGPAAPSQRDATDLIALRKGAAGPRVGEGFTTIEAINAPLYSSARPEARLIAPLEKSEFTLSAGETVTLGVVISNTGVGHIFPTELRDFFEPWLEFQVRQADGRLIYGSGFPDKRGRLDQKAHIFQSVQVSEQREWVRRHNIWDSRGKAYDNFIAPGRSELVRYQFTIPAGARGPLRVSARLLYRRFNRYFSDWALGKPADYPIVEMAAARASLALGRNRPVRPALEEADKIRFNNLGIALFDQFLFPEARRAFEAASRIDPSYADAYINQAIAAFRPEFFGEMHRLLAKALALDPQSARALFYEGVLLHKEGRLREAIERFEPVSARYPRDRFVWTHLGQCRLALNELEPARAAFEKVLAIDPDDVTALYSALEIYRKLGLAELAAKTNAIYLDKFEDWRIHYLAGEYLTGDDVARAEAVPWHVHADVDLPTPKTAGPVYWGSETVSAIQK